MTDRTVFDIVIIGSGAGGAPIANVVETSLATGAASGEGAKTAVAMVKSH